MSPLPQAFKITVNMMAQYSLIFDIISTYHFT
jgi:hypothetical protein